MASSKSQGAYGFDPSGLERAAKAAKELDGSPNAKNAFELSLRQEEVKKAEIEGHIKELDIQRISIEQSERRKTLEKEVEMAKQKSLFDDKLAKERYQQQLEDHARMQELNRKKDEESVAKQEALRRQTLEYENQLRAESDRKRILAREQAKVERLRNTKDLRFEEIKIKETERRQTLKEVWKTNMDILGTGLKGYLGDFKNLASLAGGLTLMFFGFQFAKAAGKISTSMVEARLGKPSLVRETSRKTSIKDYIKTPVQKLIEQTLIKGRYLPTTSDQREKDILSGIFINPELELNLKTLAHSIVNRKKHNAPFRNLLLYGPPGTGKTMFAKSLAKHSGMDYAILTGGDIGPLGKDGVTELHKLFDWGSTSKKGVLLFMDEADAFLRKRTTEKISEDMRNSLNALLYRTGSASYNFMLVLASNTPDQLDRAIHDRIDEIIKFDRPGEKQRLEMLYHYLLEYCSPSLDWKKKFQGYIKNPKTLFFKRTEIGMKGVDDELIQSISKRLEGFSGREIYKLVIAWHDAAFNKENAILTPELMESVLENHIMQHHQRENWNKSD
jgi:ATPase family AAA domain-containing protein 3A/B